MNNHQSTNIQIEHGRHQNAPSLILDKLSICFNDPNSEHVKATTGLLISDHIDKMPGITVTKGRGYIASCRLRLPFEGNSQETVYFEAGPTCPGASSYRLEFNPSKLSKPGLDDLVVFLNSTIDPDPLEFFRGGRITRCDVAIDLPGYTLENIIVRTSRMQKHGIYANRRGEVETTYLGTPRSNRLVAYQKPAKGSLIPRLRLECRLKPRCLGHEVAKLKNPFAKCTASAGEFVGVERHQHSCSIHGR